MGLAPHPYLRRVRDYLRKHEPGRWAWFASDEWTAEYVESVRLALLQSTYRMEATAHPELYAIAGRAADALGVNVPVTFYQDQCDGPMNAELLYVPTEAHVVLRGRILATLREDEIAALVGHELAHHVLYAWEDGSLHVARSMIEAIAGYPSAAASHLTTAIRNRLYSEIYADRGACLVTKNPGPVVACLVKIHTGLTDVDPAAYVRQAEEIFAHKRVSSQGLSHPETFVRARAIALWHERGDEAEPAIASMVQGALSLDALDVLDQGDLTTTTRVLLESLLAPRWLQTDAVLAHARAFFSDIEPARAANLPDARQLNASLQEYFAYLLLDFAVVDEALGEAALAYALRQAETMGIEQVFDRIARDELKLTKRAVEELRRNAPTVVERAASQSATEA